MLTLKRLIKTTWQRIVRSPYQAAAAIFVMILAYFVIAIFIFISLGSNVLLNYFENKPQVTAFLKDETTDRQVEEIKNILNSTGYVSNIKYVSKDQALQIYKEQNKNEPLLLEFVTANILPASLEVSSTDVKYLPTIADVLSKERTVEEVIYQKDIVNTLTSITKSIRNIGAGIVIFLLVTAILITLVVIGLNIALYREEIEIMKLVGANPWYIRTPFIFEGIFYGAISSIVATAGVWGFIRFATPFIDLLFKGVPILPVPNIIYLYVFGILLGTGIVVGTVSAFIATWKYLKV